MIHCSSTRPTNTKGNRDRARLGCRLLESNCAGSSLACVLHVFLTYALNGGITLLWRPRRSHKDSLVLCVNNTCGKDALQVEACNQFRWLFWARLPGCLVAVIKSDSRRIWIGGCTKPWQVISDMQKHVELRKIPAVRLCLGNVFAAHSHRNLDEKLDWFFGNCRVIYLPERVSVKPCFKTWHCPKYLQNNSKRCLCTLFCCFSAGAKIFHNYWCLAKITKKKTKPYFGQISNVVCKVSCKGCSPPKFVDGEICETWKQEACQARLFCLLEYYPKQGRLPLQSHPFCRHT